jgi:hypothetical protein
MMSVTPGNGSGTKELSTMETRKTPKSPKLKRKWRNGLRAPRWVAAAWGAAVARNFAVVRAAARSFIPDYDVVECGEVAEFCSLILI